MFENLTGTRLALVIYFGGYFLYVIPAVIWGWSQHIEPFFGFVLWQAVVYGPLWPFVMSARAFAVVAPLLTGGA